MVLRYIGLTRCQNRVPQKLLLEQLRDMGLTISARQLNELLTQRGEDFHQEKAQVKEAGLEVSSYIQTDDTGARHQGRNGYCLFIGNHLECLQTNRLYVVDEVTLGYMTKQGPDVPLHNNLSENDICEQVTRRKVSGGTRSEAGRRCRDTFLSLKKTCHRHGISFSAFLKDRITGAREVPPLADIIRQAAQGAQSVPVEAVTCREFCNNITPL